MRFLFFAILFVIFIAACGGAKADNGVVVEPGSANGAPSIGGKPDLQAAATAAVPAAANPTAAAGASSPAPGAPSSGRWIEVDVTRYRVRLMDGTQVLKTIEPVAVGAEVNTGAYDSTQTGLFHVYNKIAGLQYDPPYRTYISDWVGFDQVRANGFHSFLQDEKGAVVNSGTGRISNGCIRTGDAAAIFAFAEVGMPVFVHT
jgi:hypothetical protein